MGTFHKAIWKWVFRPSHCSFCWQCADCERTGSHNGNFGNYVDSLFSAHHQQAIAERLQQPMSDLFRAFLSFVMMFAENGMPFSWIECQHERQLIHAVTGKFMSRRVIGQVLLVAKDRMIAGEFAKLRTEGIIAAFHGFDSWASRTRERTDRALDGACTADRHICRSAHLRPFPAVREAGEELAKCVAGVFEETTGVATAAVIITDGASNMRVLRERFCQLCDSQNERLESSPDAMLARLHSWVCEAHSQDLGGEGFLRFSYASSEANIEEALARLEKYLENRV